MSSSTLFTAADINLTRLLPAVKGLHQKPTEFIDHDTSGWGSIDHIQIQVVVSTQVRVYSMMMLFLKQNHVAQGNFPNISYSPSCIEARVTSHKNLKIRLRQGTTVPIQLRLLFLNRGVKEYVKLSERNCCRDRFRSTNSSRFQRSHSYSCHYWLRGETFHSWMRFCSSTTIPFLPPKLFRWYFTVWGLIILWYPSEGSFYDDAICEFPKGLPTASHNMTSMLAWQRYVSPSGGSTSWSTLSVLKQNHVVQGNFPNISYWLINTNLKCSIGVTLQYVLSTYCLSLRLFHPWLRLLSPHILYSIYSTYWLFTFPSCS